MLSKLGLIIIAISWFVQFFSCRKKSDKISVIFVVLNCLGVAFFVVDGFSSKLYSLAILNTFSLIGAVLVLFKIVKKSEK